MLRSCWNSPLPPAPAGEEHPQFRVSLCAEARMCSLRGQGACWSPAFPLSFSIMLIWFLLVTATLHYSYSFRALNHSDGYNLTSTNLPNSAPLHFFNTKDKIGRFPNWLCNFLFFSPSALARATEKAPSQGLLGGEISCPFPVWPWLSSNDQGFVLSLIPLPPRLVVGQPFFYLLLSPACLFKV